MSSSTCNPADLNAHKGGGPDGRGGNASPANFLFFIGTGPSGGLSLTGIMGFWMISFSAMQNESSCPSLRIQDTWSYVSRKKQRFTVDGFIPIAVVWHGEFARRWWCRWWDFVRSLMADSSNHFENFTIGGFLIYWCSILKKLLHLVITSDVTLMLWCIRFPVRFSKGQNVISQLRREPWTKYLFSSKVII